MKTEPLGHNHQHLSDVVTSSYRHKVLQLPRRVQEQPEEHILQGKVVIIFSLSQYGAIASRIVSRNDQVGNQVDNQVEIKLRIKARKAGFRGASRIESVAVTQCLDLNVSSVYARLFDRMPVENTLENSLARVASVLYILMMGFSA